MWFSLSIILNILTGYPLNQPVTSTHGAAFLSKDNSPFHGQWLENDRGQAVVSLRPRFLKPRKSHWRCVARDSNDSNDSSDLIQELHSRVPWSFSSFAIASILSGDWNRPRLAVATRWILWCPDYLNDIVIPNISFWFPMLRFIDEIWVKKYHQEPKTRAMIFGEDWATAVEFFLQILLQDAGSVPSQQSSFIGPFVAISWKQKDLNLNTQITDIVTLLVSFRKRKLQKSLLWQDGFWWFLPFLLWGEPGYSAVMQAWSAKFCLNLPRA